MTTRKVDDKVVESRPTPECCMCGDEGLSYELFNCKICHFRYQHRYCSNLYPKADYYKVCNWCLYEKNNTTEKTQLSSSSSSSYHKKNGESDDLAIIKMKKKSDQNQQEDVKGQKGNLRLQGISKNITKNTFPERFPDDRRKVVTGGGGLKDGLRRTKSESILKNSGKKVNRARVRRYKLLEEVVCSQ